MDFSKCPNCGRAYPKKEPIYKEILTGLGIVVVAGFFWLLGYLFAIAK